MALGIRNAESTKDTVNDRKLSLKDAKNCKRKAYIFTAIVAGNIGWIVGCTYFYDDIYFALDYPWVAPVCVGICLLLDIAFIKPKNFKYVCKGSSSTDKNYTDNNYQHLLAGATYDREAQYGAQNMQQ